MSQSASQAAAFFRDLARTEHIWYVRDDDGSPAPRMANGQRTVPFWSTRARAERAAKVWGGLLTPAEVTLEPWREALDGLAAEDLRVGVNWTGPQLVGLDLSVDEVRSRLAGVGL